MKKNTIVIVGSSLLVIGLALVAIDKAYTTGSSLNKKDVPQSIVGLWQQTDLSLKSDQIDGFNEGMNNPMIHASFKTMADATTLQFETGGKVISKLMSGSDTSRYQISDDGFLTMTSNKKDKPSYKYKILVLTTDSLVYTIARKINTPELLQLLSALKLKKDTTKTITYTYTYYRIKEANAPWTAINNNLPKERWVENLITNDSTFFAIISDPSSESNDSVYTSNNHGANWSYGGYAILRSDAEGRIICKAGSKIFIATQTGIVANEKTGAPWIKIKALPAATTGFDKMQFATTATRIYGSAGASLFTSPDNGSTWSVVKTPLNPEDMLTTLAVSGNNIIISGISTGQPTGVEGFLLLSTDEGHSWKNIQVTSDEYPGIMPGYIAIAGSSILINTQYGMFRSALQQIKWSLIKGLPLIPANDIYSPHAATGSAGEAMIADGANIFYGGARGMFLSADGGESWTEINNNDLRKGVNSFVITHAQVVALTAESKLFQASVNDLVQYTKAGR